MRNGVPGGTIPGNTAKAARPAVLLHFNTSKKARPLRPARMSMAEFSQELFDKICERIADGESLRTICIDDDMPNKATVFRWLAANEALSDQYARARETQADAIFDEILDIADNAANDWMERNGSEDEGWQVNGEHLQRSRLRIDARKWMAGKLRPKRYGDKLEIDNNIRQVVSGKPLTDEQWAAQHADGG